MTPSMTPSISQSNSPSISPSNASRALHAPIIQTPGGRKKLDLSKFRTYGKTTSKPADENTVEGRQQAIYNAEAERRRKAANICINKFSTIDEHLANWNNIIQFGAKDNAIQEHVIKMKTVLHKAKAFNDTLMNNKVKDIATHLETHATYLSLCQLGRAMNNDAPPRLRLIWLCFEVSL